jgi:hypothetical protein
MKNFNFKSVVPHLIAVVVFLVVAVIYCKPVLEGKVVQQHDITNWKGSIQQSVEYKNTHGRYPLWTNSLFSGMPTFQIGFEGNNIVPGVAHTILTLGLPIPIQFFFLACICFYFLCIVLRVNPYVGMIGALSFAYATYDPVIIAVGHNTKMWSIAYMPALLGSIILIYERKYWIGVALTALVASVMVAMNHPQVDYYFFLVAGIMTIAYIIRWIRAKEYKQMFISLGLTLIAATVGLLTNAVNLLSTYEYQKETIRGGTSVLADNSSGIHSKTGLDKDYAFAYSVYKTEPLVMMFPRFYGGSSQMEISQDQSKAFEALQTLGQENINAVQEHTGVGLMNLLGSYWGGISNNGAVGTSGPPYVGAIICFLFILGMVVIDNKYRGWILTAVILTILMSWGSYFDGFNSLLYKYLPLYNKFRAPSMILLVPQLLIPLGAVLGLNTIINAPDRKVFIKPFKKALIITGGIFLLALILYISSDFQNEQDRSAMRQIRQINQPEIIQAINPFFEGMKSDRKTMMLDDILRSLAFIAVPVILIFLFLRNKLKPMPVILGILIFSFIDLIAIDLHYLNADNYVEREENDLPFQKTAADDALQKDSSFFRVFNVGGDAWTENITSYYYHSIGGYHPAKLIIYQDLIEHQMGKRPPNMQVFNMLNTKYFIQRDPRTLQTANFQRNDSALGNCWFVRAIKFVKDDKAEMDALDHFNPKDTAIVQEKFKSGIPFSPQFDSAATISLLKNDYEIVTYHSNSSANQFAVFSEIYYDAGWKSFVDGKQLPIVKVNYVLRGLALPAGQHNIEFRFEPPGYYKGRTLTSIFSVILVLIFAGGLFMQWKNRAKTAS